MKPQISKDAVDFIKADIEREIRLASLSERAKYKLLARTFKLPRGGGNLLCALALLCYTEFFGKELGGSGGSKVTFDRFFAKLGAPYQQLLASHNIYNIFRCGLAHEYWVKKSGTVFMFGDKSPALGFSKDGRFYFVVDQYYHDLIKAVESEFELI